MNDDKKISVIIPVYNVEQFLNDCVDSVLAQSYKNIELILVDDGSTDGSPLICDSYKKQGAVVIHKKNGGLSSARNAGLEIATGDYIAFADSDDLMMPSMLEEMLKCALENGAKIVCCDYKVVKEDHVGHDFNNNSKEKDTGKIILPQTEAIGRLLNQDGYKCYAWNKIYSAELFEGIRYPDGKYFEDIATTYQLFCRCEKTVYLKKELYCYREREKSITHERFSKRSYDLLNAINFVAADCRAKNRDAYDKMIPGYTVYYLSFLNLAYRCNVGVKKYELKLRSYIRNHLKRVFSSRELKFQKKIQLGIFYFMPAVYKKVYAGLKAIQK